MKLKRIISIILCIVMILAMFPAMSSKTEAGETSQSILNVQTMTAVGTGTTNWLNGISWDPGAQANHMSTFSDSVYTTVYYGVGKGICELKFAANSSWDDNFGGSFAGSGVETDAVYNASNIVFNVTEDDSTIFIKLDLTNYNHDTKTGAKFVVDINPAIITRDADVKVYNKSCGSILWGAKMELFDSNNVSKKQWETKGVIDTINGLEYDAEYTIKMNEPQAGYLLTDDVKITIDNKGNITSDDCEIAEDGTILIEAKKTSINVSIIDSKTGNAITGAKYKIYDKNGAEFTSSYIDTVTNTPVYENVWISKEEPDFIQGFNTDEEYTIKIIEYPKEYFERNDVTYSMDLYGTLECSENISDNENVKIKVERKYDLSDANIVFGDLNASYIYNGSKHEPEFSLSYNGSNVEESEYNVTYSNNINASNDTVKATVTVTAKEDSDDYIGTLTKEFEIKPKEIDIDFIAEDKEYDGTTSATIRDYKIVVYDENYENIIDNNPVIPGDDVSVDYSDVVFEFSDAEVGENKVIDIKGQNIPELAGEDADNYIIASCSYKGNIIAATPAVKEAFEIIEETSQIDSTNVKLSDEETLTESKEQLEDILADTSDNYTVSEKEDIQDEINRLITVLDSIDNVKEVSELVNELPEDMDEDDAEIISDVLDAYDELTEYEKSLLTDEEKEKIQIALNVLSNIDDGNNTNNEGNSGSENEGNDAGDESDSDTGNTETSDSNSEDDTGASDSDNADREDIGISNSDNDVTNKEESSKSEQENNGGINEDNNYENNINNKSENAVSDGNKSDNANTGDTSNYAIWVILMLMSVCGMYVLRRKIVTK